MKLYLRRFWVVMIAILTLGLYIPEWTVDAEGNQPGSETKSGTTDEELQDIADAFSTVADSSMDDEDLDDGEETDFLNFFTEQAKEQTIHKLGPRISNKIESEVFESIFPVMEEVIESYISKLPDDQVPYLVIDEQKASFDGEKIFHIHDANSDEDVLRFHVRKDLKPKQGYWFNFHYHDKEDGFEAHHEIGDVYWDKNTPPKWMTH